MSQLLMLTCLKLLLQVLKALALLRLGKHDDSSNLLDEVHAQHPIDEATLQAMCICYRETYKCRYPGGSFWRGHVSNF